MIGTYLKSASIGAMVFWAPATVFSAAPLFAASITVDIIAPDLLVAPARYRFQVTGWTGFDTPAPTSSSFTSPDSADARIADIDHQFFFDDPGATFGPFRLTAAMQDASVAFGADVAHVYYAGTGYQPWCVAVERSSGKMAMWTAPAFDVADPDVFFAGHNIVLDPDGGGDATTLAAALDAVNGQPNPKRILIPRGKTVNVASGYSFNQGATNYWPNVYIAASGSGARPIVNFTATSGAIFDVLRVSFRQNSGDKFDFVCSGIRFTGPWNAMREEGLATLTQIVVNALETEARPLDRGNPDYMHFDDCEFSGFATPFNFTGGSNRDGRRIPDFGLHACTITNWADYGIFGSPIACVLLGTEISQPIGAIGGGPKDGRHNNHGPIRLPGCRTFIMDGCDLASLTGWFPNTVGYTTVQPAIRHLQGFNAEQYDGQRYNIRRNVIEGEVAICNQDNSDGPFTFNGVVAQNILIGNHMVTNSLLKIQWGGCTIENNICHYPQVANLNALTYVIQGMVSVFGAVSTPNSIGRIAVRHNTFHVMQTTAQGAANVQVLQRLHSVVQARISEEHNIVHAPNLTSPITTWAPLAFASTITPKYTGYQRRREVFTRAAGTAVAVDASFDLPYSAGSFAAVALGTQTSYQVSNPAHSIDQPYVRRVVLTGVTGTFAVGNTITGQDVNGTITAVLPGDEIRFTLNSGNGPAVGRVLSNGLGASGTISTVFPHLEVQYLPSVLRVFNRSGGTWPASTAYTLEIERDVDFLPPIQTIYATPAVNLGVVSPLTGSPAIGGAGTVYPRFDILSGNRRTIIDPLTRVNATRGAVEVALES